MSQVVQANTKSIAQAIAAAEAADDAFEAAIKAAGYKSRWDWNSSCRNDNRPSPAYEAKIKADSELHYAFERSRAQPQAPRREDYAPYHTLDAFAEGVAAYAEGDFHNPYDGVAPWAVKAQAWDRGLEYAARVERHAAGLA